MLPAISAEQLAIVSSIQHHNVIVDSVAGSGKTTTILYIASAYPSKNILLLTYNTRLRKETQSRAAILGVNNLEIHTYHSFGQKYTQFDCKTDLGIIEFINSGKQLLATTGIPATKYDIIIIDECQDMIPLFYKLVIEILRVNTTTYKLCIIGDKNQSIFDYNGADSRFITLADAIYPTTNDTWRRLSLSVSYRITRQMAAFINKCVLGYDRITAVKDGPVPKYTICNLFNPYKVMHEIKNLLASGYGSSDIFILAPSINSSKANNPTTKLSNLLTKNGIVLYMPTTDDDKLNPKTMEGKVVFSTFHQVKGLERKAVIVLRFDESYFTYYCKKDPTVCSDALYVAITRATTYLSVYHDAKSAPLKFINMNILPMYAHVTGKMTLPLKQLLHASKPISVTELTKYISSDTLFKCMTLITCTTLRAADALIDIPTDCQQMINGVSYFEDVSDITGVALPALYEYSKFKTMSICTPVPTPFTVGKLLEAANKYIAKRDGRNFKVNQINKYDWLGGEHLQQAHKRLSRELDQCVGIKIEVKLSCKYSSTELIGYADVIDNNRIIEIKAVRELKPEHFIQVLIYGYINMQMGIMPSECTYHLFNVLTDELILVTATASNMEKIISILIAEKTHQRKQLSNEEFLIGLTMREIRPEASLAAP